MRGAGLTTALTIIVSTFVVAVVLVLGQHGGNGQPLGVRLQRAAGAGHEVIFDQRTGVYSVEPMQEDDQRWNCHTMGNRRCGR